MKEVGDQVLGALVGLEVVAEAPAFAVPADGGGAEMGMGSRCASERSGGHKEERLTGRRVTVQVAASGGRTA